MALRRLFATICMESQSRMLGEKEEEEEEEEEEKKKKKKKKKKRQYQFVVFEIAKRVTKINKHTRARFCKLRIRDVNIRRINSLLLAICTRDTTFATSYVLSCSILNK